MKNVTDFEKDIAMAEEIAKRAAGRNGRAYYVGGFVRDGLLGIENKDIDLELHGISADEIRELLAGLGHMMTVGESFGIFGLKGYGIDIAIPRKEMTTGRGHRDFDVSVDPFIGAEKAAMRRDFTVNALMQDVLTGEVLDFFGGRDDLMQGILRHVSDESFSEDPLRVLRAAQFAARFEFTVAEETVALCRGISLDALSHERVEAELKKALLKAKKPSVFFEVLRKAERLDEWFPELQVLIGVEQNPVFHGEGDVWNHTMMVIDEAAKYRELVQNPFGFMLAAVAHDFGKAVSTQVIDGKLHAYAHETKGLPLIDAFLRRLTNERQLKKYVLGLCEYHMKPNVLAENGAAVKSTNRMFDSVCAPRDLIYLSAADNSGRISEKNNSDNTTFLFDRLGIYEQLMSRPFVQGKDLIEAGLTPDKDFTEILAYSHKLRLAGVEKESALKQTLAYARKIKKML